MGTPQKPLLDLKFDAVWRTLHREGEYRIGGSPSALRKAFDTAYRINHDFRRLGGEELPAISFWEGLPSKVAISQAYFPPLSSKPERLTLSEYDYNKGADHVSVSSDT